MTSVHTPTRDQLMQARASALSRVGASEEDLAARAEAGSLLGEEWSVWAELREIDYLLHGDRD